MLPRNFFLDIQSRAFVGGPSSAVPASAPSFFEEDVEEIALYFMEPTGGTQPYRFVDYSANSVILAIGITAPAVLQTSWTATSTAVTASITTLTNGGGGSNEVQRLSFTGEQPAEGSFSLTLPSRVITVSSVSAGVFTAANHGLLDGQQVALSSFTISGSTFANTGYFVTARTKDTFQIAATSAGDAIAAAVTSGGGTATLDAITTGQIAEVSAPAIQQAFVDAGIEVNGQPQIIVTGSYSQGFTITFANSQANINFAQMTVSSTLAAATGLKANVSFNTNEVAALIAAGQSSGLRMEVEVSDGTKRQTYATSANIADDIITSTSTAPLPSGSQGFILLSPDDSQWLITVDDEGVVTSTKQ